MFDALTENLGSVFDRLRGRGALSERDVETALGDIRKALLEADVALPVVGAFIDRVRPRAIGAEVLKSVTPARASAMSCGCSSRHGPHQLAQTLRTTGLPVAKSLLLKPALSASSPGKAKSGTFCPVRAEGSRVGSPANRAT